MINTRVPTGSKIVNLPSAFAIGDEVFFQPYAATSITPIWIPARVSAISFEAGKVLYDLELPLDDDMYYEARPLQRVDSIFIETRFP